MLLYSKEIIDNASRWIEGDLAAKKWLESNKHGALIHLRDASLNDPKAIEYLLINKHFVLAAFVNAIWEDKKALKILMDRKEYLWAAMSTFINGDEKAAIFLEKNKLKHYLTLAINIQNQIRKLNDKRSNFFNSGPYKV